MALVLDLPAGAERHIVLDPEYRVAGDAEEPSVFRRARDARRKLKDAQQEADETLRDAVAEGRKHRLSLRDIATMTDVSYQRVAQVASDS